MNERSPGYAGLAWPALAVAQQPWPQRAITIVVPFAPGGPVDNAARPLAEGLRRQLGQPIVIENRAGAGGLVGTRQLAQARPADHRDLGSGGARDRARDAVSGVMQ